MGQGHNLQDPTIQRMAKMVEQYIEPSDQQGYESMVAAGMTLMFDDRTSHLIEDLSKKMTGGPEDAMILSDASIMLLGILWKESGQTVSPQAMFPALQMLTLHGMDFLDRAGKIAVGSAMLDAVMDGLSKGFLRFFGIGKDRIAESITAGQKDIANAQAAR